MSRNKSESTINRKLLSVKKYLENKYKKHDTLFRIENGVGFYVMEGLGISVEEMEKLYPTNKLMCFKENSDTRNLWMS